MADDWFFVVSTENETKDKVNKTSNLSSESQRSSAAEEDVWLCVQQFDCYKKIFMN